MSVVINDVKKGSAAYRHRILPNDILVSINGNDIDDVLDYEFYAAQRVVKLIVISSGAKRDIIIKKGEYEDIGFIFNTFLIDKQRVCKNKCIFCFIDQMPPGMRETLYVKDDDARMSFLMGNYITLTNVTQKEIDRIVKMHISPINISVHTTNRALRISMMANPNAGDALDHITTLGNNGIAMNCQLVLCRNINDGEELRHTLLDLEKIESIQSIACVPVGLTAFRDGLVKLTKYDKQSASEVIDIITSTSTKTYPSDEFFLLAERPIPPIEYYGDLLQLENGVGMLSLFMSEFYDGLQELDSTNDISSDVTVITGVAVFQKIKIMVDELIKKCHNIKCRVVSVRNDFFGNDITVAGLITATDIIAQLSGLVSKKVLITESMLKDGEKFLDDITVVELEEALSTNIIIVPNSGYEFLDAIIGE